MASFSQIVFIVYIAWKTNRGWRAATIVRAIIRVAAQLRQVGGAPGTIVG